MVANVWWLFEVPGLVASVEKMDLKLMLETH